MFPTGSPLMDVPTIALATGAVALVLLAAMLASFLFSVHQRRHVNSPRQLLRQICEAHELSRRQRRLLLQAARVLAVQQPARLFLEPRLMREAAAHPALASRREELERLSAELFGQTAGTYAAG